MYTHIPVYMYVYVFLSEKEMYDFGLDLGGKNV